MKIWQRFVISFMLFSSSVYAGNLGGDIQIDNKTHYTLVRGQITPYQGFFEFVTPETVGPYKRENIYLEPNGFNTQYVEYSSDCPSGQKDTFRISITRDKQDYYSAKIILLPVGHSLQCLNLDNNLNIEWHWNGIQNYMPAVIEVL